MGIPIVGRIGLCGIAAGLLLACGVVPVSQASALSPWFLCAMAREAHKIALETTLAPANGSTVEAGTPVTLSGSAEFPLSFAIASSSALLSTPDIDGGPGSAQPQQTYTFASNKATATPRTIYWQASFSDASIPECAGKLSTITTDARTLIVLPTASPPAREISLPPETDTSSTLQVSIGKPTVIGGSHVAGIAYEIHCNLECTGQTSYQAFLLRRRTKPRRMPKLGAAEHVTVAAASGGQVRVEQHYRGAALRAWTKAIHAGETIEVRVVAEITGSSDETVEKHRSFGLRL